MATRSWLLTVSVLVEQDEELAGELGRGWHTNDQLRDVVIDALARSLATRPDVVVEWESMTEMPLDGHPGVGRREVCNRWVYDAENRTEDTPTRLCIGAIVDGHYLCDECLPKGHPLAF